ncbi:MAG: DUF3365 domain-containing protein [Desulfobacteraceae bacterium]|nr:DUF3365 domain-containing protein [Desulfobacteraceae bacterium]
MVNQTNIESLPNALIKHYWYFIVAWSLIISGILLFGIDQIRNIQHEMAKNEAKANFNKDQAIRFWSSMHGGVYVPISKETSVNPYLNHVKDREITTPSGAKLTLMNPAYMLRQVMEKYEDKYGIRGHITSLKHFRPETAPDEWERKVLNKFNQNVKEYSEFTSINGSPYFRYMAPMETKKGCLKCHGHQGYKVGDIRGGVSISIPIQRYLNNQSRQTWTWCISLSVLWLIGFAGLTTAVRSLRFRIQERDIAESKLQKAHDELDQKVKDRTAQLSATNKKLNDEIVERKRFYKELQESFEKIKVLQGFIPICSHCKKIRDDQGYWNSIESYLHEHSEVELSHSICQKCAQKHYPDYDIYEE